MIIRSLFCAGSVALLTSVAACGGDAPAKSANDANDAPPTVEQGGGKRGGGLQMNQELGSIDQRGVEMMTNKLVNGKLETVCHKKGRDRLEYMTGDMKMFFRIDGAGTVKYSYFEDSNVGDRETEKCVLDTFANAEWPKPIGGEAEVRYGFGWMAGGERAPASWGAEKVMTALDQNKAVKESLDKCKAGVSGDFKVTAYVEAGEIEGAAAPEPAPPPAKGGKKPDPKKASKKDPKQKSAEPEPEHGGKFKAIGMAAPNKDGAEKVDCLIDALKTLPLPTPGSYVAKVSFSL